MSQKPHKIEVFPTTYENDEIDFAKIENYLKEVCDISDETIASVRRNLLGEDVDFSI